ncbi:MarR family transcriptional regulator [Oscillospiraceae bacterium NSJ-54]|uniref:MarR family transcriptional regulator n=2 Tax=Zongyangia hominis TaxID=2763677 RepID=A0A926IBN7_9FIRM|nr:MarR family transcriptional regulator [Zongyangia hominis]
MELDILLFLSNNPPFDTATDIVERRKLTKSHVSTSIAGLARRGYLARSFQGENKKLVHLRPLPAAVPIIEEGQQAQQRFFSAILAGFSKEEAEAMESALIKITGNARSALQGGTFDVI